MSPRTMYTKSQARAIEAQTKSESYRSQAELMQKQVEEARKREKELIRRKNDLFEAFMQRFLVQQSEDRAGPAAKQVEPKV